MKKAISIITLIGILFYAPVLSAQERIGVVLSGGGATGMAHIGVLIALEEEGIPIDYITGTSIGSLIGGLYACGYSPLEIREYMLSERFSKLTRILEKKDKEERFLLRERDNDASMISFHISLDSVFKKSLPTNLVVPSYLDFELMRVLGQTGAITGNDFDSLFIPFRCVASDIYNKKGVVFKDGDLNAAVRASMTYPFYINPIRIGKTLYFDGGLYNNFPADIMYHEFNVDYIIGSNVSSNGSPPSEEDIIGQVSNMFVQKTDYGLPCNHGIIIEPDVAVGTFEFSKVDEAIQYGYEAAKKVLDSICVDVTERVNKEELAERRKMFREKLPPLIIDEIIVESNDGKDVSFIENNFISKLFPKPLDSTRLKQRYFRTYSTPQVKYIFPTLEKITDSTFRLKAAVTKQNPFVISVGGHFTSRSVNTGYFGLSYLDLWKGAVGAHAEVYFGKFYTSTRTKIDFDLPSVLPFRITPYFVLNRWDFYKSFSTFFEDVDPSFLKQNELYYGISASTPITNNGILKGDFRKFQNKDQYYQTLEYSAIDTADVTFFQGETMSINFVYNTLNRKQWASEGAKFNASFRFVQGKEKSISGNTQQTEYDMRRFHQWINLSIEGQQYFKLASFFKIGIYGKMVFNSQSLFSNYLATTLTLTDFSPLPDSETMFLAEYRAPQYIGGGFNFIFNYKSLLELRIDPYFFQPLRRIVQNEDGSFGYVGNEGVGNIMAGASLIFHTPIGPLRLSTNWFPKQKHQWITQLSFGYVIFNNRAFK